MASVDEVFAFVIDHRNTTNAVLVLDTEYTWDGDAANGFQRRFVAANTSLDFITRYQIWYNSSLELSEDPTERRQQEQEQSGRSRPEIGLSAVRLQLAFDRALLKYGVTVTPSPTPRSFSGLSVKWKAFPSVPTGASPDEIAVTAGTVFFYCAMMFGFILLLVALVSEKEKQLRSGLLTMGLPSSVFWISWLVTELVLAAIGAVLVVGTGWALGFAFFRTVPVSLTFALFFGFGAALIPFAFALSTMLQTTKSAVFAGIVLFVFGLLLTSILFAAQVVYLLYDDSVPNVVTTLLSALLPLYNFGKIYTDIAPKTYSTFNYATNKYETGPGFSWSDMGKEPEAYATNDSVDVAPPMVNLIMFGVNFVFYLVATWYLDEVMPSETGMRLGR
ncbi:uncharacterized protein AMSG_11908 [Thecamonas trahens ATCC 50062]|uniref:ABC-2 type transporter transmembrane domain-containing protein n=1 Tax=Thecamonas trahens ATCC 50062 TaxID=461836 RepID=A0A0L0DD19_THETB|nr:hypothetical protein AMSG_11908 [Thecamonas trahens ATCC 50062]KNC50006.1 hypothetical protein AMSG_11908 [Thecamonas trahens ATCC 50062]|eukprot:XP_013757301.1 hypothetical protein AMSG_11908 [Thecamonas trahens ATCC 50062]